MTKTNEEILSKALRDYPGSLSPLNDCVDDALEHLLNRIRAAGREEQREKELKNRKLCACCAINLGEASEELLKAYEVGKIDGVKVQCQK